ncbi:hypothetical protein K435DRAFT_851206 [Dendrothele bispora CBS 962.96]|uniref:Uncharacterized protein n=1 Tax=Dendrothele bispora (strain CBS 962.96) TaxID=1314807 RepID=A0A4S8MMV1_DENBC|nr:hypothetical protein K435DRAFT_851206 [Dendrothele bispora CBS 962.96]
MSRKIGIYFWPLSNSIDWKLKWRSTQPQHRRYLLFRDEWDIKVVVLASGKEPEPNLFSDIPDVDVPDIVPDVVDVDPDVVVPDVVVVPDIVVPAVAVVDVVDQSQNRNNDLLFFGPDNDSDNNDDGSSDDRENKEEGEIPAPAHGSVPDHKYKVHGVSSLGQKIVTLDSWPSTFQVILLRLRINPPIPWHEDKWLCQFEPGKHNMNIPKQTLFRISFHFSPEFVDEGSNDCHPYKLALHAAYNYLIGIHPTTFFKLFSPFFDFSPTKRDLIHNHSYWSYLKIKSEGLIVAATSNWIGGGDSIYVISLKGEAMVKQWYLLGLYDAISVLQLFRQSPAGGELGVLEAPLKSVCGQQGKHQAGALNPLGSCPHHHVFKSSDYQKYEQARDKMLHSNVNVGRAALMWGGIIWQLVKDMVHIKKVTDGPTHTCGQTGASFGQFNGHFLCNKVLEVDEEELIIGVYKIPSCRPNQGAHMSWWPKMSTWLTGKMNHGFWSDDDEN